MKRCDLCGKVHGDGLCEVVLAMMKHDSYRRENGAIRQVGWGVDLEAQDQRRAFRRRVEEDIRGRIDEELRRPEMVQRWYDELILIRQDVEAQLSTRRAEMEALRAEAQANAGLWSQDFMEKKARYERWRASAVKFLSHVNRRIREARALIVKERSEADQAWDALRAENEQLREENRRLRARIDEIEAFVRGALASSKASV